MKKEPILICLYAYFPFANANTNVMLPLINALANRYEVHILTKNKDNSAPFEEEVENGIIVHRYPMLGKIAQKFHTIATMDRKKKRKFYKTIIVKALTLPVRFLSKLACFQTPEYSHLVQLMKQYCFAFVITTCAEFTSHRSMLHFKQKTQDNVPWIAYFMDPFAYYIANRDKTVELLEVEKEVYKVSDLVLVTEEIYRENHSNELSPWLDKTKPFRFGNFQCLDFPSVRAINVDGKINCVYVGSLIDERIRNPQYLYKLINEIDDRFVFHIVCNNPSVKEKKRFLSMITDKERVRWYENLPLNESLGIICHADILINLGNKSVNQTPSKIFDYIGTGRPIVNFYSLESDTSKRYLDSYPLKLNIYESDDNLIENVVAFRRFAEHSLGQKVSPDKLQKLYKAYDSDSVTADTVTGIDNWIMQLRR